METATGLFGGLGLFLLGIRELGANLQQLSGRRVRAALGGATAGRLRGTALGLLLGALTQSSNAVTTIVASLVTARMVTVRHALPVLTWSNVGTAGLVMLATVDLWAAVLWLMGVIGFASAFRLDRGRRMAPAFGAVLGLGLLFLGLTVLKQGAVGLREAAAVRDVLAFGGDWLLPSLLASAVLTLLAQSSSTTTILAITLHGAGLLGYDQTVMAVYGASLGSGLAVLITAGQLRGTALHPALFQLLLKLGGSLLFLALFVAERWGGVPLVLAALPALAADPARQMGWLFLLLQLATALVATPLLGPASRLLGRLCPPTRAEALAQPQFLYDEALADPPSALELVAREQQRLAARLPLLLDEVREDGATAAVPRHRLAAASAAVERAVAGFLADLLGRGCDRASMEQVLLLEGRLALLASLRETVLEFADTVAGGGAVADTPLPTLGRLAEALHLLLEQFAEALEDSGPEEVALLLALTADRGETMQQLRRRVLSAEPALDYAMQERLARASAAFERAVWLVRRLMLSCRTG